MTRYDFALLLFEESIPPFPPKSIQPSTFTEMRPCHHVLEVFHSKAQKIVVYGVVGHFDHDSITTINQTSQDLAFSFPLPKPKALEVSSAEAAEKPYYPIVRLIEYHSHQS